MELRLRDLDHLLDRAAVLRDVHTVDALDVVVRLPRRRLYAKKLFSHPSSEPRSRSAS